jgi:hypothetical protein
VDYQSALEGGTPNGAERANQKRGGTNLGASQALLAPDLVENLAEFARVSRQIYAESRVLNFFILWSAQKPEWPGNCIPGTTRDAQGKPLSDIACEQVNRRANLELDVRAGDPIGGHPSIPDQGFEKLAVYQDIRTFAQQTEQMNTVFYGAITAYLLPVFYSLLGACAFGLRNTIPQAGNKTYQPSYFDKTRLIIALIAGTVVGLFNNFTQGVSASPLAIAFLVGYAVEVFFSFLDALVRTFEGVRNSGAVSTTGRV